MSNFIVCLDQLLCCLKEKRDCASQNKGLREMGQRCSYTSLYLWNSCIDSELLASGTTGYVHTHHTIKESHNSSTPTMKKENRKNGELQENRPGSEFMILQTLSVMICYLPVAVETGDVVVAAGDGCGVERETGRVLCGLTVVPLPTLTLLLHLLEPLLSLLLTHLVLLLP